MAEMKDKGLSRRNFLAGAATLSVMGAAALAGCGKTESGMAETGPTDDGATEDRNIVEVIDCDIVIAGAGISGLACAVQAAQEGLSTVLLEKSGEVGGNGMGTEGVFAVGSHYQKEQGIEIKPSTIVRHELESAQWRLDGSVWMNLVKQSADNIQWLEDNGVEFSGVVDNYHTGVAETMHWFKDATGGANYIPQMTAAAEKLGVDLRTGTPATAIIMEDGVAKGLYARNAQNEDVQINAKAVVLASGGIGGNVDILKQMDIWTPWRLENAMMMCVPTVSGDGYTMAMEAGAKSVLGISSINCFNGIKAFGTDSTPPLSSPYNSAMGPGAGGPVVWVNQDGKRFNDESLAYTENLNAQATAVMSCRESYVIFDQPYFEAITADPEDAASAEQAFTEENKDSVCRADSIEELAENFGVDPAALAETIEGYNAYCAKGEDDDFGKPADFLVPIATPPYYMCRLVNLLVATNGGISTDVNGCVVDENLEPIDGLYAIGMDGIMLWRNVGVQAVPGTATGGGVNFGRNAARHAASRIKG